MWLLTKKWVGKFRQGGLQLWPRSQLNSTATTSQTAFRCKRKLRAEYFLSLHACIFLFAKHNPPPISFPVIRKESGGKRKKKDKKRKGKQSFPLNSIRSTIAKDAWDFNQLVLELIGQRARKIANRLWRRFPNSKGMEMAERVISVISASAFLWLVMVFGLVGKASANSEGLFSQHLSLSFCLL